MSVHNGLFFHIYGIILTIAGYGYLQATISIHSEVVSFLFFIFLRTSRQCFNFASVSPRASNH